MIVFDNVRLQYPYDDSELFQGLDFSLTDGVNTVLCDVQSGKTSLCRLLLKDVSPTDGRIFMDGRQLDGIAAANLDILYLPRDPVFFESRSILYNIEYPLKVRKIANKSVRRGIASELAERLGISETRRKARTLSAEERKRVALARGLTVPRKRVLWDDFFENADGVDEAMRLFDGATQILVTSDAALARGNTVVLDGGKAVFCGDANCAKQTVESLQWLYYELRSK